MRARVLIVTAALATATAAGLLAAGTASAATPIAIPQFGAYGLELSHGETQSLANSPLPALVDRFVPHSAVTVGIQPDSALPQDNSNVYAGLNDIVGEAASRPGGQVDVLLDTQGLIVFQQW
ncbi:hypothetical protein [Nocardia sp. NPDC020380]|uniref:hypothetical protein n=1 Tax=Nocardia sp. NPDC020380 TaxID=3364309 RepID=UPI0037B1C0EB